MPVGLGRLELPTSRLSGVRSNQAELQTRFSTLPNTTVNQTNNFLASDPPSFLSTSYRLRQGTCIPRPSFFLRKEVIQPQLPLQLPCYDFVPVTSPTFGGSFLAVRFPTSGVTRFHDVTGGVYKARERIHRAVLIRGY